LCFGFLQITITLPCRFITLHFSHIGLTDGLTFIAFSSFKLSALASPCYASAFQVVGRNLDRYLISGKDPDVVHTQFARYVRQHFMAVLKLDFEYGVWKRFRYSAFHLYHVAFRQVASPFMLRRTCSILSRS
jgi:hypothetical protein